MVYIQYKYSTDIHKIQLIVMYNRTKMICLVFIQKYFKISCCRK